MGKNVFAGLKNLHAKNANNRSHKFDALFALPTWALNKYQRSNDGRKHIMKFPSPKTTQKEVKKENKNKIEQQHQHQPEKEEEKRERERERGKKILHDKGDETIKSDLTYRYGNIVWSIACVQFPFKSHYRVSWILVAQQ